MALLLRDTDTYATLEVPPLCEATFSCLMGCLVRGFLTPYGPYRSELSSATSWGSDSSFPVPGFSFPDVAMTPESRHFYAFGVPLSAQGP